jgi:hypothetical protein
VAGSRLAAQYAATVAVRQFYIAAENMIYTDKTTEAPVAIMGVVDRQQNTAPEHRKDGEWEIWRAIVSVMAVADAVYGGLILHTADQMNAFRGTRFQVAAVEGGPLLSDWRVDRIWGGPGTWEMELVREKRIELGGARKGKD